MRQRSHDDDELLELLAWELVARKNGRRRRGLLRRRLTPGARRELFRELQAIRALENRLARSRYPEVREILAELLEEARERELTAGELTDLLTGRRGVPFWERFDLQRVLLVLAALATLLALPSVREKVRPLLKKTIAEALELGERGKAALARLGEDLEDIVAEAQFNRLKESLEPEPEPKAEE
ncbi:MAG: DUF5132 domain-containing protein [Moorella sp. (in: Bacteria)]|nr:DUF5132 domain-containing protein [Moorella sp. (in: firmicutes)]